MTRDHIAAEIPSYGFTRANRTRLGLASDARRLDIDNLLMTDFHRRTRLPLS
jgi:hypothetical protein